MKTLFIVSGIGIMLLAAYPNLRDHVEYILDGTEQVAGYSQQNQLELALELYYLEYGYYPQERNELVVDELHRVGLLRSDTVPFTVAYVPTMESYRLAVR